MDFLETERKYDVSSAVGLPAIETLVPKGVRIERDDPIELDATYFDTDDRRLVRHHVTLRRRRGGSDEGWHLKVPAHGDHARLEIRRPVELGSDLEVPSELADHVLALARGGELRPVARLRTTRNVTKVLSPHGESLVEVANDLVRGEIVGEPGVDIWREAEVEVGEGGAETADAIDRRWRAAGVRESGEDSKLARLLGEDGDSDASRPTDVIHARVAALRDELLVRDLEVRRGSPDSVHDMRVAIRRLRSCLRTFAPVIDGSPGHVADDLRWFADALGTVRDLEVLGAGLERSVGGAVPALERTRVLGILRHRLDAERSIAAEALDEALRSERYLGLLDALDALVDRVVATPDRDRLFGCVETEVHRTRRRLRRGLRASGGERDVRLHAARRGAKRARYAAETVGALAPSRAQKAAARYEKLQELLGARQDAVVARAFVRKFAIDGDADLPSDIGFYLGLLVAAEDSHIADFDRTLARRTKKLAPKTW